MDLSYVVRPLHFTWANTGSFSSRLQIIVEEGFIMFGHCTNTASFFSVLMAALIFSLSLAGVAAAEQTNTNLGKGALQNNTTGSNNTASGLQALFSNATGYVNTATG